MPADTARTDRVHFRITPELKVLLQKGAAVERRTVSGYIEYLVVQDLIAKGLMSSPDDII